MNKQAWGFILLLLLTTIEYRIDLGFISVMLVEPIALLYAAWVLGEKLWRREPIQWRHPLFLFYAAFTLWAIVVRPFSPDWKHGLSDIRDWLIPTVTLLAFINVRLPHARLWHTGFVAIVMLYSGIGIVQHFVDSPALRPFAIDDAGYKNTLDGTGIAAYGVAFFSAPNGFGLFLVTGIFFMFGWLQQNLQRLSILRYALLAIPLVALYYTYSRTSILVLMAMVGLMGLHYLIRPTPRFVNIALWSMALGTIAIIVLLELLPHELLRTFWWRIALWEVAAITLRDYPLIWLFGNGIDRYIPIAFYPSPHNQFVFALLEYGLIGVFLTVGIIAWVLRSGLQARQMGYLHSNPLLAAVWFGLLGQFIIIMVETSWLGLTGRLLFVCFAALYGAILTETDPALLPQWRLPKLALPQPQMAEKRHS